MEPTDKQMPRKIKQPSGKCYTVESQEESFPSNEAREPYLKLGHRGQTDYESVSKRARTLGENRKRKVNDGWCLLKAVTVNLTLQTNITALSRVFTV